MLKKIAKVSISSLLVILFYFITTYIYLYPGSKYLLQKSTIAVLSDGTDQLTAPYQYRLLVEQIKKEPSHFFYGAIFSEKVNPPSGFVFWHSWLEKTLALILSLFFPIEQISAGIAFFLITLGGVAMFYLARQINWNVWISLSMGLAWSLNPYTLARSKVHPMLAGTFFIPILFIALNSIKKSETKKDLLLSTTLLLILAASPHYYITITLFLAPFWLYYIKSKQIPYTKSLRNLLLASLPALCLLLWTITNPIPSELKSRITHIYPTTGQSETGIHDFLTRFAAKPIDYLSGNIALTLEDPNPIKEKINHKIFTDTKNEKSIIHEHAVGIRWTLLLLALASCIFSLQRRRFFDTVEPSSILFFILLGVTSLWLSLSPQFFGFDFGPSLWLHQLLPQFRVPSRASVFVHFAVLMLAGISIQYMLSKLSSKLRKYVAILFPLFIVIELPPHPPPLQKILMSNTALETENCGIGMYFPYVSGGYNLPAYYYFLQSFRNSSCTLLNSISVIQPREEKLLKNFAHDQETHRLIQTSDKELEERLLYFSKCVPLEWLFFDPIVPQFWRERICDRLNWKMANDFTCTDVFKNKTMLRTPEDCLQ